MSRAIIFSPNPSLQRHDIPLSRHTVFLPKLRQLSGFDVRDRAAVTGQPRLVVCLGFGAGRSSKNSPIRVCHQLVERNEQDMRRLADRQQDGMHERGFHFSIPVIHPRQPDALGEEQQAQSRAPVTAADLGVGRPVLDAVTQGGAPGVTLGVFLPSRAALWHQRMALCPFVEMPLASGTTRGCAVLSRRSRLTTFRTFAHYHAERRMVSWCRQGPACCPVGGKEHSDTAAVAQLVSS